ncbi:BatD family protein [Reinekea marina]|uniref:BatD family protein n=1 Tax=Reinekea marina TaxID=1310421 RepID=A0ABV7WNA0_9GAMM|nr:BatD family protein [Reinekea marina]MDN3648650.1 BatD family protein [Reinekea marina]
MVRIIFFIIATFTLAAVVSADVTVTADRLDIYEDESFLLTVSVSPSANLNRADVNALESIFTIVSRGQSTQSTSVNGQRTSVTEYQFRLAPKEKGLLGIPVFTVNGEQSDTFFINVKDAKTRSNTLEDDAIIYDVSVSDTSPYIDQTLYLTIEVAYRVALNGQFTKLSFPNFETGEQQEQQRVETREGKSYNVYTLTIPLTPRSAGAFSLPEIEFNGQYQVSSTRPAKRISLSAKPEKITVKPIPSTYPAGAYWLPVSSLTISDNLDNDITLEADEHLNWSITQNVTGISANLLPDPLTSIKQQPNIQLYRDNPIFKDADNNSGFRKDIAALSFKNQTKDNITLPEVRVPWWNINSDQLEYATLPSRTIILEPNQPTFSQGSTNQSILANSNNSTIGNVNTLWIWLSVITSKLLLMSIALNIWLLKRDSPKPSTESTKTRYPSIQNVEEAYSELLKLLRHHNATAEDLKRRLTPKARNSLQNMELNYFGSTNQSNCSLVEAKAVLAEAVRHITSDPQGKENLISVHPS